MATPLHKAISQDRPIDEIKRIIDNTANLNEKETVFGYTALIKASRFGDLEIAQYLLTKGANIDEKDDEGYTALIMASKYGFLEIVKLLLEKGACIDEQIDEIHYDNKTSFGGDTALIWASRYGRFEIVKLLIEKGANIDKRCKSGYTALITASCYGHQKIVQYLIDKGANINKKTKYGNNALIKASFGEYREIVQLLIEKGAKIDEKNNEGNNALILASAWGYQEIVQLLQLHRKYQQLQLFLKLSKLLHSLEILSISTIFQKLLPQSSPLRLTFQEQYNLITYLKRSAVVKEEFRSGGRKRRPERRNLSRGGRGGSIIVPSVEFYQGFLDGLDEGLDW